MRSQTNIPVWNQRCTNFWLVPSSRDAYLNLSTTEGSSRPKSRGGEKSTNLKQLSENATLPGNRETVRIAGSCSSHRIQQAGRSGEATSDKPPLEYGIAVRIAHPWPGALSVFQTQPHASRRGRQ